MIINLLKKCKDNYVLVLSDRISQLDYLQEKLGYGVKIDGTMTSKKNKELREQHIQDMREGKERVIYASYRVSKRRLRHSSFRYSYISKSP